MVPCVDFVPGGGASEKADGHLPKSPTFDPSETQHHFPNRFSIHQRLSGGHFFENDKKSIYPDLSRVQDSFTGGAALGSDFSVLSDVPCFSNVLLEKVKEPLRDGFSKCLRLQEKKSWSTRSGSLQSMGGSGTHLIPQTACLLGF